MRWKNGFTEGTLHMLHFLRRLSRLLLDTLLPVYARLPQSLRQKLERNNILRFIYRRSFTPVRTQRFYVKRGMDPITFLDALNRRNIEYVLLRWWENLPAFPAGEDLNILVKDEHRDLIAGLVTSHDRRGIKCDIYTVGGSRKGSRLNVPVFPCNLSRALLSQRVFFNGAYIPAPVPYFASVAYHAVYHKGHNSGVPGFDRKPTKFVYDYTTALKEQARKLGIQVDVTVAGLQEWLKKEGFAPADDTLTKLIENRPELSVLQPGLFSDARGGELLVYVVRERLVNDGLLNDFLHFLEYRYGFDVLDVRMLPPGEKEACAAQIRGGKWDSGPFRYSGGLPAALVVAYDYHPKPLTASEQKKQTRVTDENNIHAKYDYRERLKILLGGRGDYNGVHSADNERDAWFYLSFTARDYQDEISAAVECRRERYAAKWGVKKVLSAGRLSKTELIRYGQGLAVKKTYRPGKESFLENELVAVKDLSGELKFIPPLLEQGDGYYVVPYFENVLETLPEKDRKRLLASKKNEVAGVIREFYRRGYAYISFSPANVMITPGNDFYCRDFEYLLKYGTPPKSIDDAYEVAGLPPGFMPEHTNGLSVKTGSFNKVWGPYLGRWKTIREGYPVRITRFPPGQGKG